MAVQGASAAWRAGGAPWSGVAVEAGSGLSGIPSHGPFGPMENTSGFLTR